MYQIHFYQDKNGYSQVKEYIDSLLIKKDKTSRVKYKKILAYLQVLQRKGTYCGEPFVKHIENKIWELRPLQDRILFAVMIENEFILLHQFVKKTKKTPKKEIERARREWQDILERRQNHEGTESRSF